MKCVIPFCKNYTSKHPEGVRFYRITEDRYPIWMAAIRRTPEPSPNFTRRVCSEHFTPDSFTQVGKRIVIKNTAVPTLKLRPVPVHKRVLTNNSSNILGTDTVNHLTAKPCKLESEEPSSRITQITATHSVFEEEIQQSSSTSKNVTESVCGRSTEDSSSSDTEGLTRILRQRRKIMKLDHNYCIYPSATKAKLDEYRKKEKKLQRELMLAKAQISRMQKNIDDLKERVKVLSKRKLLGKQALNV